ncbi:alpha/beta fold hydrolase [Microbacterium sp. 18062]|uniref:alpha/beta fold hydrolase n=1 Tax=Microbacterium sp. 18062 TaxID=2681410 RepID=UPI00135AF64C|nr:alpha/beta hydrolase [Microbacterium sp. 18062]
MTLRHAFADTRHGQIHYVAGGEAHAPRVVLLHQSPRSWDEYRDVLPLLAPAHHAVAVDSLGFGGSVRRDEHLTIEAMAEAIIDVLDQLGGPAHVVGHHTGGVVGIEVAASRPDLVRSLVLSGVPYVDAARRASVAADRPPIDGVEPTDDGSFLLEMWRRRASYYPADRPDLLRRLVTDALRVFPRMEEGHVAVNSYRMEDRLPLVSAPVLAVCGEHDSFSLPDVPRLLEAAPKPMGFVQLDGVGVPSVDHDPAQFAETVAAFVARIEAGSPRDSARTDA